MQKQKLCVYIYIYTYISLFSCWTRTRQTRPESEGARLALGLPCLGHAAVNMRRTTLKCFEFCKGLGAAKLELLHCQVNIHWLCENLVCYLLTSGTKWNQHMMVRKWTNARKFQDEGLFLSGFNGIFCGCFSLFWFWDEGAATNNKTIRFVFQWLVSCW